MAAPKFDCNKSLEQLDGQDWGKPPYDSHLVIECHRLRRVPLNEFTTENLRIMIGQQIGLPYLIPLELDLLHTDPFAAGDYHGGDLLVAVLRTEGIFWCKHSDLWQETAQIVAHALSLLPSLNDSERPTTQGSLTEANAIFQRSRPAAT